MFTGMLSLVSLAGLIAQPAPPVHYRLDLKFTQTIDYTSVGGPLQEAGATLSAFVTLTEHDTLGGHQAMFRFDSVSAANGDNVPPTLADDPSAAKGVVYTSMIANGRPVGGFKTSQVEAHANLFQSTLDAIFPGFRASAKSGDKWIDTVMAKDSIPVIRDGTTIISWTASSVGNGVITLDGATTGSSTVLQATAGGSATVKATLTGSRHVTGPALGAATNGTLSAKQNLSIQASTLPDPLPGKVEQSVTITRLP